MDKQAHETLIVPVGPFAIAAQKALCEQAVRLLGFDFEAGRLDVSTHPFCGGVPEDVRMTTRFREDDFLGSLMGKVGQRSSEAHVKEMLAELKVLAEA